jgi:hypothetical protein
MSAPLLSSRARFSDRWLLQGKMQLYDDALVLEGWTWAGRYRQRIPLVEIASVEWWDGASTWNLVITVAGPTRLLVHVGGAGRWKYAILEQIRMAAKAAPAAVHGSSSS